VPIWQNIANNKMSFLYQILSLPALIPFFGLASEIAGYVALFRYWGNWPVFIGLLALGWYKNTRLELLQEELNKNGLDSKLAEAIGALCCVLQTTIIIICLRSF
tara:strand:+ start:375 stop:686 length:312 start_codon:yes stop_codon:yes gene_type:complete